MCFLDPIQDDWGGGGRRKGQKGPLPVFNEKTLTIDIQGNNPHIFLGHL